MSDDLQKRIEDTAEQLGASRVAIYKWRVRGVPAEWKIKLVEAGGFSFDDFENIRPFRFGKEGQDSSAQATSQEVRAAE